ESAEPSLVTDGLRLQLGKSFSPRNLLRLGKKLQSLSQLTVTGGPSCFTEWQKRDICGRITAQNGRFFFQGSCVSFGQSIRRQHAMQLNRVVSFLQTAHRDGFGFFEST